MYCPFVEVLLGEAAMYSHGVEVLIVEADMFWAGVEVLLWGECYVISWCGSAVVGRLICTVVVLRSSCGEDAMYCRCVEKLLLGVCYVLS